MDEMENLKNLIRKHDNLYYGLATPEISDYEYDLLMKKLIELEKQDPSLITPDSPTQRVGNDLTKKFNKVSHSRPMMSISNVYTEEELIDFDRKVKDALDNEPYSYVTEFKIDGVAIALRYEDGLLVQALTRGNGTTGDDITNNARTIKSIPLSVNSTHPFEVRGEVYMDREVFNKINEDLPEDEQLQNPRNAASGALKLQDPREVSKRNLKFLAHFVFGEEGFGYKHSSNLTSLKELGFPVEPHFKELRTIEEVIQFTKDMNGERAKLKFDVDGIVVKVNLIPQHDIIGYTAKAPKWVVAYKYKPEEALTKLLGVDCQVGRTGVLTPVARLEPVFVSGSTISNATLHNYEEVARLGLRQGDWVWVEKGGEIIPKITRVEPSKRPIIESNSPQYAETLPFPIPKVCPVCGDPIVKEKDEVAIRCPNVDCPAQVQAQIEHFVSRGAMNMEDIGPSLIEQMLRVKLISNWDDLYKLSREDLSKLERMGNKSAENVLVAIEKSKSNTIDRVIFSLGIKHIGSGMSTTLSERINSVWDLKDMTIDELRKIPNMGEIMADSIHLWFCIPENIDRLMNLEKAGIKLNYKNILNESPVSGRSIVVTGTLKNFTRSEIEKFIYKHGGKLSGSVSKKTDFLIVGENPGSKHIKAIQLGIKILTEDIFVNLIGPVLTEAQSPKPKVENIPLF